MKNQMKIAGLAAVAGALVLSGCAMTAGTSRKSAKSQEKLLKEQVSLLREEVTTLHERLAQIDQQQGHLQAQISQLEERRTNTRRTRSATVPKKLSVRQVQQALANAGHYSSRVDGKLGSKTRSAIKAFQRANGLKVDGVVGAQTRSELVRYLQED